MKKGTTTLVRKINKYIVLQYIFEKGPLRQEDIIKKTRLSRPTITEIVRELLEENILKKAGRGESSGGREPVLLDINETSLFAVGVDFEYPKINIGIINLKREAILESSHIFPEQSCPNDILTEVISQIDMLIEKFPFDRSLIIGIGIGLPGIIDNVNGVSKRIERIAGWENIPIKDIFEKRFGIPVYIQNDVHLLATLEIESRCDIPDDFIFVSIRSGIGMAVVMNGEVYHGFRGNAGFLGHMTIDINGDKCVCGQKGCLEMYAGQLSQKRRFAERTSINSKEMKEIENVYDFLYRQTLDNNIYADELLTDACVHLAYGIANVIKIIEIPTIVLEGVLPFIVEEKYAALFKHTLKKLLFENMNENILILQSKSENKMIINSCGNMIFKQYIKKNYYHWTDESRIKFATKSKRRLKNKKFLLISES